MSHQNIEIGALGDQIRLLVDHSKVTKEKYRNNQEVKILLIFVALQIIRSLAVDIFCQVRRTDPCIRLPLLLASTYKNLD